MTIETPVPTLTEFPSCYDACCGCVDAVDDFGPPDGPLDGRYVNGGWQWSDFTALGGDPGQVDGGFLVHEVDLGGLITFLAPLAGTFPESATATLTVGPDLAAYGNVYVFLGNEGLTEYVLIGIAANGDVDVDVQPSGGSGGAEGIGGPGSVLRVSYDADSGTWAVFVDDHYIAGGEDTIGLEVAGVFGEPENAGTFRVASQFEVLCEPTAAPGLCGAIEWDHCWDAAEAVLYVDGNDDIRVDRVPDQGTVGGNPLRRDVTGEWGAIAVSGPVDGPLYDAAMGVFGGEPGVTCDPAKAIGGSMLSLMETPSDTSSGGLEGGAGIEAPYWGVHVFATSLAGGALADKIIAADTGTPGPIAGPEIAGFGPVDAISFRTAVADTPVRTVVGYDRARSYAVIYQVAADGTVDMSVLDSDGVVRVAATGASAGDPFVQLLIGFSQRPRWSFSAVRAGLVADTPGGEIRVASAVNPALAERVTETARTPTDLTWDALFQDALNTATTAGTGVSQWDDSSGNGRHVTQGTDANRPSRMGNAGADYWLDFNGTSDRLIRDLGGSIHGPPIFLLGLVDTDEADITRVFADYNGPATLIDGLGQHSTGDGTWAVYAGAGGSSQFRTGGSSVPGTRALVMGYIDTVAGSLRLWVDGVLVADGGNAGAGRLVDYLTIGALRISSAFSTFYNGKTIIVGYAPATMPRTATTFSFGETSHAVLPFPQVHEMWMRLRAQVGGIPGSPLPGDGP